MDASSTQPLGTDFPKQMVELLLNTIEESTKEYARIAWSLAMNFLAENWLWVMGGFVFLLVVLFIKALMGQWGSLYSLTYWTLYAIIVFIVGLIWGPEALVSDIYHVIYIAAIWPLCYLTTAWIWDRFGFRRRR